MQVLGRRAARRAAEAAEERALARARHSRHRPERERPPEPGLHRVLNAQDGLVAVRQHRGERLVEALLPPARVDDEGARDGERRGRSEGARDEEECEVDPGHDASGRHDVAVVHEDLLRLEPHVGKPRGEGRRQRPMRRRRASREKARLREQEGARADGAEDCSLLVPCDEPGCEAAEASQAGDVLERRGEDERRERRRRDRRDVFGAVGPEDERLEHGPVRAAGGMDAARRPEEVDEAVNGRRLRARVGEDSDPRRPGGLSHLAILARSLSISPLSRVTGIP